MSLTPASAATHLAPAPVIHGANSPDAIPGQYIVKLKDTASLQSAGVQASAQALVADHRGTLKYVYDRVLPGFAAAMTEEQALALASDPGVAYIEQDRTASAADSGGTQDLPPWGLDRIDQQNKTPLSDTYRYGNTASNVHAYILDSGIRTSHNEFGGRAYNVADFVNDGRNGQDCAGHGTAVASVVGGQRYGVAKGVLISGVRVLDCTATGDMSQILAGVNWIAANAVKPAVANISIQTTNTEAATALNDAVSNAVDQGITFASAAGNYNADGCYSIFTSSPKSINVAATDNNDARWSYSNWGPCVTMFAPGVDIPSAGITSDSAGVILSGTSMAAPHVAGEVALLMGSSPQWAAATPAQIKQRLLELSTKNAVSNPGAGTPNYLLFTAPPPVAGGSPIALARDGAGKLHVFGSNAQGDLWHRSQNTPSGSNDWSPWENPQFGFISQSVAAEANEDGRLDTISTTNERSTSGVSDDIFTRHETQPGTWSIWSQAGGKLCAVAAARDGDGRLWEVGVNQDGKPWIRHQLNKNVDTWTNWTAELQVFAPGVKLRSIAAEADGDGRIHVVMLDSTGNIWHTYQDPTAQSGSGWSPAWWVQGSLKSVALARRDNGRLELFGTNSEGMIWHRTQLPDRTNLDGVWLRSNWDTWVQFDGSLTSVAAESDANNRIMLIGVNNQGQIWYRYQDPQTSAGWSPWHSMDGILRG